MLGGVKDITQGVCTLNLGLVSDRSQKFRYCNPHTCTQYHHHVEKNPAEKAVYVLPKKAVYLFCQKGSLPLLPKMAVYPKKKKKQEEEAEEERRKKKNKINE